MSESLTPQVPQAVVDAIKVRAFSEVMCALLASDGAQYKALDPVSDGGPSEFEVLCAAYLRGKDCDGVADAMYRTHLASLDPKEFDAFMGDMRADIAIGNAARKSPP